MHHLVQHLQHGSVIAAYVEQAYGFAVLVELRQGEGFEMFVHGTITAGEGDHAVGAFDEQGSALGHGFNHDHVGHADMAQLQFGELVGDNAGDRATVGQHGVGKYAHEADAAAAKEYTDIAFGQGFAQFGGRFGKPGLIARIGATKNCYGGHRVIDRLVIPGQKNDELPALAYIYKKLIPGKPTFVTVPMNNPAMYRSSTVLFVLTLLLATACQKKDNPEPPDKQGFTLHFHNEFNVLEAEYAAFLSDENGTVRAFRWLPGSDTARLSVPDALPGDRFDCTVVKIVTLIAPGTGVRDTTVTLTTYTNLFDGANIYFRDPNFLQSTDLFLRFTNLNALDSIIVPDGLTFARPQPANNFTGQYRVLHTGRIWCRILMDGESNWRYAYLDNVAAPNLDTTLDAAALPLLPAAPKSLSLPLLTAWDYKVDGVIDATQGKFLAIGDLIRAPGGAVPVFDQLNIYQPPGPSFAGYRMRFSGFDSAPGGFGYTCDLYSDTLPAALPEPDFDIQATAAVGNRDAAIQCNGFVDVLVFTRTHNSSLHLGWETLVAPNNTDKVSYRLPDVPPELAQRFSALKNYDFGETVRVRGESYRQFNSYPEVIARRMLLDDPLWQMKAGYVARERVF